jgi:hypothetical protein
LRGWLLLGSVNLNEEVQYIVDATNHIFIVLVLDQHADHYIEYFPIKIIISEISYYESWSGGLGSTSLSLGGFE